MARRLNADAKKSLKPALDALSHWSNNVGSASKHILTGDRVRYVISNGEVRILAVRPISRLFGMLQHKGPAVTLEEMEQAIADGACKG